MSSSIDNADRIEELLRRLPRREPGDFNPAGFSEPKWTSKPMLVYNGFTHQERVRGWQFEKWAIAVGLLPEAEECSICGSTRSVLYHGENYYAPLNHPVLCLSCHTRLHNRFRYPQSWVERVDEYADGTHWFELLDSEILDVAAWLRERASVEAFDPFDSERYPLPDDATVPEWAHKNARPEIVDCRSGVTRIACRLGEGAEIAELESEGASRCRDGVPTVAEYVDAFKIVEADLSAGDLAMLRGHYAAPGRVMTARQLAEAAAYQTYKGANIRYGRLGGKLNGHLDMKLQKDTNGRFLATSALATGEPGDNKDPHDPGWQWTMRAEVAAALKELGWVG